LSALQGLRAATAQADCVLNDESYARALAMFRSCLADSGEMSALQRAADYQKREFLLCVDCDGAPVRATPDMLASYGQIAAEQPSLRLWLEPASAADGSPVLLTARWLCHLAGFRHRTVHLLIDHPTRADYTLLQVRGLSKPNYPACFDVPAAGHVIGLDSVRNTVIKELQEELGLAEEDIVDLRPLGSSSHIETPRGAGYWDVEHIAVFAGRLAAGGLDKIAFADGEAAGLCIFAISELQTLAARYPEQIASGLTTSLPLLLKVRTGAQ
jgi:isopentenyldiphosphate isomerase